MIDNTMTKRTSKITFLSILTALAIMINILEFMIPPPIPVGGFKWGFSNFILLMTLYQFGIREAFIVGMLKVLVASFFSGRFLSPGFFMGLSGTFSSLLIMSLLFRGRFGMMVISVSGAFISNTVQLLLAALLFVGSFRVFYLSAYVIILGTITGIINAIMSYGGILWLKRIRTI